MEPDKYILISGTRAAKKLGIAKNQTFVKKFVKTGLIKPVRFPGSKRDVYVSYEVDHLIEKCRRVMVGDNFTKKVAKDIINKFKLSYEHNFSETL